MGILEAPQPGSDAWWRDTKQKINDLQRELDQLRAAVGKYGAVFNENGITIRDGGNLTIEDDGNFVIGQDATLRVRSDDAEGDIAQFGDVYRDGDKIGRGMSVTTGEGLQVATVSEEAETGSVFWEFRDAEQNVVLANDVQSGFGLRSPQLQYTVTDFMARGDRGAQLGWPWTEDTFFDTFGLGESIPLTHPRMRFVVDGGNSISSTTLVQYQVEVSVGGVRTVLVTSDPMSPGVTWVWEWDVAAFPQRHARAVLLDFQMRRVSGFDRVYARVRGIGATGSA